MNENAVEPMENLFLLQNNPQEKIFALLEYCQGEDFILRHKAYYLLRELKEQSAVPFLLEMAKKKDLREEDALRILDVFSMIPGAAVKAKSFLHHKNPYLVRGELIALGKNGVLSGGSEEMRVILHFAASGRGRLLRRELVGEVLGYMLERSEDLKNELDSLLLENPLVRGYLRDMPLKGPKYGRLSLYPANDYWALKARSEGLDYGLFKDRVETIPQRKTPKGISVFPVL